MLDRVGGADRRAVLVERREADAALDDQRVLMRGDDVAESHAADGVGRQPRVHPDLDVDAVERELAAERPIGRRSIRSGTLAGDAGDDGVVAGRQRGRVVRRSALAAPPTARRRRARGRATAAARTARSACPAGRRRRVSASVGAATRGSRDDRQQRTVRGFDRRARAFGERDAPSDRPVVGDQRRRVEQRRRACARRRSPGRFTFAKYERPLPICQFRSVSRIVAAIVEAGGQRARAPSSAACRGCDRAPESRDTRARRRTASAAPRRPAAPSGPSAPDQHDARRGEQRDQQVRRQVEDVRVADVVAVGEDRRWPRTA